MNLAGEDLRTNHERITIPTLWVAIALSILIHALGLFGFVPKRSEPFHEAKLGHPSDTLAIRLVPFTRPPPSVTPPPSPQPTPRADTPRPAPRPAPRAASRSAPPTPRPAPPVLSTDKPAPITAPPPVPAQAPAPAPGEDLASYIASRRRAREGTSAAPPQPQETEQEKHNRVVAENLGLTSTPTFGNDPERGGGVFQIRSMGFDIAEFAFFGWNKDINRNSLQVVEVRKGNNPNMELAVARRMIAIIRERSTGDFLWQSRRLGKGIWLSARPADSAELEAFILRELFPDPRPR